MPLTQENPEGDSTSYTYTTDGLVETVTNPNTHVTTNEYSSCCPRLKKQTDDDGFYKQYEYDPNGNLTRFTFTWAASRWIRKLLYKTGITHNTSKGERQRARKKLAPLRALRVFAVKQSKQFHRKAAKDAKPKASGQLKISSGFVLMLPP